MNRKKTILIILLIVFTFLIVYLLNIKQNRNEDIAKNIETIKIKGELPMVIKKPVFDNQGMSILSYKWEDSNLNYPQNADIYLINDRPIDNDLINKFKNYFGIKTNPIEDNENAIAFVNKPEGKNFYINKKDRTASYYIDLITQDIKPKENVVEDKNLIESLKNIVKGTMDWPDSLNLEKDKVERQEVVGMMYQPSNDTNSRVVYIEMTYKLDGVPIYTKRGLPITARFFDDGTLLKYSLALPFSQHKKIAQLPIKNIEKIKNQPNYEFKILSIKDGGGTELLTENGGVVIQEFKINKGYLAYVYEIGNNILQPFLAFEGEGTVGNKKVILVVGTPALNDNEYN